MSEPEAWNARSTERPHTEMMNAYESTDVEVCLDDADIVTWLEAKGIGIVEMPFRDTMALGRNVAALDNGGELRPEGPGTPEEKLRAPGFAIFDLDLSITAQGGGAHCMSQSPILDPV